MYPVSFPCGLLHDTYLISFCQVPGAVPDSGFYIFFLCVHFTPNFLSYSVFTHVHVACFTLSHFAFEK